MREAIETFLVEKGADAAQSAMLSQVVVLAAILLLSLLGYLIARRVILASAAAVILRTRTDWDDALISHRVLHRVALLVPALIVHLMIPAALAGQGVWIALAKGLIAIYAIIVGGLVIGSVLNAGVAVYQSFAVSREIPIRSFVQVIKIVVWFVATILIISILVNKTPYLLLSGLGALTAVILLIFRDSILGFVAGIQLSANKMLAQGDWIEMPKYGADGDVEEVTLTTVKVRNWDKTITTIPTYALISESFRNWRGMQESGGRRIKRSINIDVQTVRLCTEEMLERFSRIQHISEYTAKKREELAEFNTSQGTDDSSLVNGRRLTNIGTFRAYVKAYLWNHPMVRQDMTFLIRQLQPTEHGLPIEIYVFCASTVWAEYEAVQADIFDHILAVVPEFDLRVYQQPSGEDIRALRATQLMDGR